jgi:hypothetical protein
VDEQLNISKTFEQELAGPAPSVPSEWIEGQHKFFLVEDKVFGKETALSRSLDAFALSNVKVLDFQRFGNYWVIKTMAPRA